MKDTTGLWIFGGILALFLVPTFIMAIYSTVQVDNIMDSWWWTGNGAPPQCSCFERQQAINVWNGLNGAVNLVSIDPTLSTQILANYFAPLGSFALPFPPTPIVGPDAIFNFFLAYATGGYETNVSVTDKQLNWDCLTQTLSVQRTWKATLLQPRGFIPNSTVVLPAGTTYEQDDFVITRFNCDYKVGNGYGSIVYYREYFDNTQTVSTYSETLTPVCAVSQVCNIPS